MHALRSIASITTVAMLCTLLTATHPSSVFAQPAPELLHLDLVEGPGKAPVPGNCSSWHELFPVFCNTWHQDDFADNGDGELSACDRIELNGQWYHIEWVGPTYFLSCDTDQSAYEPTDPNPTGENPTCEIWREIAPNFGNQAHVDGWQDSDGDGLVSVCDNVQIAGRICHIDRIGLNIIGRKTTPPVPDGTGSWGMLKSRYDG